MLELRGVNKRFGAVVAARDISVSIVRDSIVGLIGANGAGKTTFVNLVTGYLKADCGAIEHDGRDIARLTPREITRLGVARSFQIPQLFDTLSVQDNLLAAVGIVMRVDKRIDRRLDGNAEAMMVDLIEHFGLCDVRHRPVGVLPEGLRKLVDVAMAMASTPQILLLDEPTSGVSADEKFAVMDKVMHAVAAHHITVLFVEHDMDIVERYAHRVLAFYEGRIIADDKPAQALLCDDVRKYVIGEVLAHA